MREEDTWQRLFLLAQAGLQGASYLLYLVISPQVGVWEDKGFYLGHFSSRQNQSFIGKEQWGNGCGIRNNSLPATQCCK